MDTYSQSTCRILRCKQEGVFMPRFLVSMGVLAIGFSSVVVAQDTRTVVEPKIPTYCAKLEAQLTSVNGCGKGKGVVLQVHGGANAFLSGPLQLREGVTLVVDAGVTLYESIDPQVLEASPGSCGLVNNTPGRGCKQIGRAH